jgi:hypothetical protein
VIGKSILIFERFKNFVFEHNATLHSMLDEAVGGGGGRGGGGAGGGWGGGGGGGGGGRPPPPLRSR